MEAGQIVAIWLIPSSSSSTFTTFFWHFSLRCFCSVLYHLAKSWQVQSPLHSLFVVKSLNYFSMPFRDDGYALKLLCGGPNSCGGKVWELTSKLEAKVKNQLPRRFNRNGEGELAHNDSSSLGSPPRVAQRRPRIKSFTWHFGTRRNPWLRTINVTVIGREFSGQEGWGQISQLIKWSHSPNAIPNLSSRGRISLLLERTTSPSILRLKVVQSSFAFHNLKHWWSNVTGPSAHRACPWIQALGAPCIVNPRITAYLWCWTWRSTL